MNTLLRKMAWIGMACVLAIGMAGCEWVDRAARESPTDPAGEAFDLMQGDYTYEGGPRFSYAGSDTPGITVKADLTPHHISGEPYGTWRLNASWRDADRSIVTEITIDVTVDATTGQATALLPPDFLNTVFTEADARYIASQDDSLWHHRPGLYLNFYPGDDETLSYFTF